MGKKIKITLVIIVIFIIVVAAVSAAVFYWNQNRIKNIDSFEDCAKYYPVLETYPEQCRTPDGRNFTRPTMEDYVRRKYIPPSITCQNLCGDEACQEVVCQAVGCPCAETKESCPDDCK